MNLYLVFDSYHSWCCFAFDTSRNKAKSSVSREFETEFTELRCITLKKGVNVPEPMLVTDPVDYGYDFVKECGFEYVLDDNVSRETNPDLESE